MTNPLSTVSAAPCRHRGAPSEAVIEQVISLLSTAIPSDDALLNRCGLSSEEYTQALPAAIERLRGRKAASNSRRRNFVEAVMDLLVEKGVATEFRQPRYGRDTIYRLFLKDGKQVGLVQKGCPDGRHSSVAWSRPSWADELYLWWVCDSKAMEPGEHIWKGITRVRGKVSLPGEDQLDGVIFCNRLCGTQDRPCPKIIYAVESNGVKLPPPCIYTFPHWTADCAHLNWRGEAQRFFPAKLLSAFGIPEAQVLHFVGHVGFRFSGATVTHTEITNRYGTAKVTTALG